LKDDKFEADILTNASTVACLVSESHNSSAIERLVLLLTIVAGFVLRAVHSDQPIVENYVGRQVPTAMVARNLDRGSGFLRPRLDTAPMPNYFLVEPPVYELAVVAMRRLSGWRLEECGRFVSALATSLGAWAFFELIRRREEARVALAAMIAFSLFPVTIRYGRAFQPDALMLGAILVGLNCLDLAERARCWWWWRSAGWLLLALGFAAKLTAAVVLIPVTALIMRPRSPAKLLCAIAALAPVLCWYVWAGHLIAANEGSRAAADNRAIWLTAPGVWALGSKQTLVNLGRFLVVRAFTPVGFALGLWGLCQRHRKLDEFGLWKVWGLTSAATMALLAVKLHHEYYWLILAPAVAAGIGRAWMMLRRRGPWLGWAVALALVISSALLSYSTWQTPPEWEHLVEASRLVQYVVPKGDLLVGSEPLIYQADRPGCRLEFTPRAAARAASEWPGTNGSLVTGPLDLVEFYRSRGARFVADLVSDRDDKQRKALYEALRRRYKVRVDRAFVIIAELEPSEFFGHGH
jgi:4-amino-4-deoxy-L-arabinose transferase-like glycosyltransferase